jgi:hypothetical protein
MVQLSVSMLVMTLTTAAGSRWLAPIASWFGIGPCRGNHDAHDHGKLARIYDNRLP